MTEIQKDFLLEQESYDKSDKIFKDFPNISEKVASRRTHHKLSVKVSEDTGNSKRLSMIKFLSSDMRPEMSLCNSRFVKGNDSTINHEVNIKKELNLSSSFIVENELIKRIKISDIEGDLFWGKEITLDSQGLRNGLRQKRDGVSYFGFNITRDSNNELYNDFILNWNGKEDMCENAQIFAIAYNKEQSDYIFRVVNKNIPILYEITSPLMLDYNKQQVFQLGRVLISILPKINNQKYIEITVNQKDSSPVQYSFTSENTPITFGRMQCSVNIKCATISKDHARITFENMMMFYFHDSGSINGSYVVMNEGDSVKLKGESIFKLESNVFRIYEHS